MYLFLYHAMYCSLYHHLLFSFHTLLLKKDNLFDTITSSPRLVPSEWGRCLCPVFVPVYYINAKVTFIVIILMSIGMKFSFLNINVNYVITIYYVVQL